MTVRQNSCLCMVVLGALLTEACGSNPSPENRPDPRLCASAWANLYSPVQPRFPQTASGLRRSGDRLYFGDHGSYPMKIQSIAVTGGDPVTVYQGDLFDFWIEDGRLIVLTTGGDLLSVPVGGGVAEPALMTGILDDIKNQMLVSHWSLDSRALYWAVMEFQSEAGTPWTIWRAPRDGSGDVNLGAIPKPGMGERYGIDRIVPLGDRVLVTTSEFPARALSFPIPPGPISELPSGGDKVIALSDDGTILWSTIAGRENGQLVTTMARSRADGSAPEPYWSGKPRTAEATAAWSDGSGGWYVHTIETGTDQSLHATVWRIDGAGAGAATRLACDPEIDSSLTAAAVSPTGLFAIDTYNNQYWRLVEISAPAPAGP